MKKENMYLNGDDVIWLSGLAWRKGKDKPSRRQLKGVVIDSESNGDLVVEMRCGKIVSLVNSEVISFTRRF